MIEIMKIKTTPASVEKDTLNRIYSLMALF